MHLLLILDNTQCTEHDIRREKVCVQCVFVTLNPNWSLEAAARLVSAPGGWQQVTELWPGHETPHRGSHLACSPPPLDLAAIAHFPLTRGWRPGGGVEKMHNKT